MKARFLVTVYLLTVLSHVRRLLKWIPTNGLQRSFGRGERNSGSSQIGKLQITQMFSDARLKQGDAFSVRKFHDYVWLNGNVPIVLQRWELRGIDEDVKKLDATE